MQPDTEGYAASVLYAILIASNNSEAVKLVPAPPNPGSLSSFTPSTTPRWINGLWFTSLVLSLAVALLSILVKQWLDEYTARTTASAKNLRHWARRRAFFFQGVLTWHVSAFISFLPLLLHIALFLFFGGLVLLLWDLDRGISLWLLIISAIVLAFYVAASLVPFIRADCPAATPLVRQLHKMRARIYILCISVGSTVLSVDAAAAAFMSAMREHRILPTFARSPLPDHRGALSRIVLGIVTLVPMLHSSISSTYNTLAAKARRLRTLFGAIGRQSLRWSLARRIDHTRSLAARPALHVLSESQRDDLDSLALHWLILSVSDSDAVAVGLQALGAIQPFSSLADHMRSDDIVNVATFDAAVTSSLSMCGPSETMRIVRTLLSICDCVPDDAFLMAVRALRRVQCPDLALIVWSVDPWEFSSHPTKDWLATSSTSLTWTVVLMFRAADLRGSLRVVRFLYFLLCVRFEHLSRADWRYVLDVLRRASQTRCLRHTVSDCDGICFAELFAELIFSRDLPPMGPRDAAVAAQLIERVAAFTWETYGSMKFSQIPHLLRFVGSAMFRQCTDSKAITTLSHTLYRIMESLGPDDAVPSVLGDALTNLLHAQSASADLSEEGRVYDHVARIYTWLYERGLSSEYPNSVPERPRWILLPAEPRALFPSSLFPELTASEPNSRSPSSLPPDL